MKSLNQRQKTALGLLLGGGILVAVVIGGLFIGDLAMATDFTQKNVAPGISHPFGTDWMGREMFLRTVKGLSMSVSIGVLAASISAFMGIALGTAAALLGRKVDAVISWLIDMVMGIPHLVLLILISFAMGKGFVGVVTGVALTHWTGMARIIRGEVIQLRESQFIQTAERLGQSKLTIAVRHMVPNVYPQFLVGLILLFPHAILHEASITFLGFGLSPEQPAIGIILSESMRYLASGTWWLALFPGAALVGTVMLFDLAGGSLRKLIDPGSAHL